MRGTKIFTFLVTVLVGVLIIFQFRSQTNYRAAISQETTSDLASESALLVKNNQDTRAKILELEKKYQDYQSSLSNKDQSKTLILDEIEKNKKEAGLSEISGQGVEINVKDSIKEPQLVDLVNALKNIGVLGISINDKRLIISSGLEVSGDEVKIKSLGKEETTKMPLLISACGDSNLLFDALRRKGGIEEQLKGYGISLDIQKKDNIRLPAI